MSVCFRICILTFFNLFTNFGTKLFNQFIIRFVDLWLGGCELTLQQVKLNKELLVKPASKEAKTARSSSLSFVATRRQGMPTRHSSSSAETGYSSMVNGGLIPAKEKTNRRFELIPNFEVKLLKCLLTYWLPLEVDHGHLPFCCRSTSCGSQCPSPLPG